MNIKQLDERYFEVTGLETNHFDALTVSLDFNPDMNHFDFLATRFVDDTHIMAHSHRMEIRGYGKNGKVTNISNYHLPDNADDYSLHFTLKALNRQLPKIINEIKTPAIY